MGEITGIAWTDHTWNPFQGCTKVSEGCRFCYMYREKKHYGQEPGIVKRSADATFRKPLSWHRSVLAKASGGLTPKRELVFTCSWSDFFHPDADAWRPEAWEIIRQTPYLTYQILTKRPERIPGCLPLDWGQGYPNVWLGATVENDAYLWRLDYLLNIPAIRHFASCGPLLGPLDLEPWLNVNYYRIQAIAESEPVDRTSSLYNTLSWVIVEGESGGPPERALVEKPLKVEIPIVTDSDGDTWGIEIESLTWQPKPKALQWVRSIRDQCQQAGVPFFLKGWGGPKPTSGGNLLDNRTWLEVPV